MLAKYKIANTLRIISEPKNGITIIPNPTGSGKSYETAIFIAWMLINSGRKIIFVTTRIAHLNLVESDIAYHLKEMGEQDKIDKVVQIKSFVNCIKQSFLRLSDDIERIANRNKDLKEVFTVLRSELIRLEVETKNSKNNQDSNKAVIKNINEHISNLEPKFRNLLSEEFAKSYNHNRFDQKGNCISSYDYMMNSEEWKFIAELYPSSQHSQKQVFIMTSAKFLEKDDPIISKRYDFIKGEHLKDAIVIIDEVDAVKNDFLRKILSNDLKKNIVDIFKVIYRTFENIDEMDPDTIEVSKSIGKIKAISNRSKEIKEKYFPSKWVVRLFEKDDNGEFQEANVIDKLMNFYSVDNYFDTTRKYVYIPFTSDRNDPDNITQCNIIISENDLDEYTKTKITMYNIADFIKEVNQFINRTFFDLRTISNRYMENENKRNELNPDKETLWIDETRAISTLLTQLSFSEKNVNYLVGKIVSATDFKNFKEALKPNNPETPIGSDVYDRGLCYTSITQNYNSRHSYTLDNYEYDGIAKLGFVKRKSKFKKITKNTDSKKDASLDYQTLKSINVVALDDVILAEKDVEVFLENLRNPDFNLDVSDISRDFSFDKPNIVIINDAQYYTDNKKKDIKLDIPDGVLHQCVTVKNIGKSGDSITRKLLSELYIKKELFNNKIFKWSFGECEFYLGIKVKVGKEDYKIIHALMKIDAAGHFEIIYDESKIDKIYTLSLGKFKKTGNICIVKKDDKLNEIEEMDYILMPQRVAMEKAIHYALDKDRSLRSKDRKFLNDKEAYPYQDKLVFMINDDIHYSVGKPESSLRFDLDKLNRVYRIISLNDTLYTDSKYILEIIDMLDNCHVRSNNAESVRPYPFKHILEYLRMKYPDIKDKIRF